MNQSKHNGKVCYYCRQLFNDQIQKTKDHVVAKSRGGFNVDENYVDACYNCNQWKADKTLSKWLREVQECLKRGKHRYYTKIQLGQIVGNIKKLLKELKQVAKISTHKIK